LILGRPWGQVVVVAAVAVVAGIGAWLLVRHSNGDDTGAAARGGTASSSTADVSAQKLVALVGALGRPIYWAGPKEGVSYEFTETSDRRVYVRYLPKGVPAGSAKPFLTVASYPVAHAFAVTRRAAAEPGSVEVRVGNGGVGFYARTRPTNVYVAFPGSDVQIEAYDPSAAAIRKVVSADGIRPVDASEAAAAAVSTLPTRTTKQGLARFASTLGQPVYWLGAVPGRTLELSRTPDGRVYVRYLPAGVAPGARAAYLTVATYPLANGLAATKAAAAGPDTVRIPLRNGAVAFYARSRPTNVYVAFPGIGEQIEVFDPSATALHRLVAANRVAAAP